MWTIKNRWFSQDVGLQMSPCSFRLPRISNSGSMPWDLLKFGTLGYHPWNEPKHLAENRAFDALLKGKPTTNHHSKQHFFKVSFGWLLLWGSVVIIRHAQKVKVPGYNPHITPLYRCSITFALNNQTGQEKTGIKTDCLSPQEGVL